MAVLRPVTWFAAVGTTVVVDFSSKGVLCRILGAIAIALATAVALAFALI